MCTGGPRHLRLSKKIRERGRRGERLAAQPSTSQGQEGHQPGMDSLPQAKKDTSLARTASLTPRNTPAWYGQPPSRREGHQPGLDSLPHAEKHTSLVWTASLKPRRTPAWYGQPPSSREIHQPGMGSLPRAEKYTSLVWAASLKPRNTPAWYGQPPSSREGHQPGLDSLPHAEKHPSLVWTASLTPKNTPARYGQPPSSREGHQPGVGRRRPHLRDKAIPRGCELEAAQAAQRARVHALIQGRRVGEQQGGRLQQGGPGNVELQVLQERTVGAGGMQATSRVCALPRWSGQGRKGRGCAGASRACASAVRWAWMRTSHRGRKHSKCGCTSVV